MFDSLARRELTDLETCRRVWEFESDPLALCEAVRLTPMPAWLSDALIVMLTDGTAGYPALHQQLWNKRARHAIDAERAATIAMLRTHPDRPQTWEMSFLMSGALSQKRYSDMPKVSHG